MSSTDQQTPSVVPESTPTAAVAADAAPVPVATSSNPADKSESAAVSVSSWQPDGAMLQGLLDMLISYNAAVKALYATGNSSVDEAMLWICQHLEEPDLNDTPNIPGFGTATAAMAAAAVAQVDVDSYKMVIVLNTSLKMGTGKMVSQAGHAILALYQMTARIPNTADWLAIWETSGAKKITLAGQNTETLRSLQAKAQQAQLPNMLIQDAGRTQVAPGSVTALAVFGASSRVDEVTGHLKLL